MNNDNSRQNYDDEIDLRQLFKSLKERSRFIFGFTGVVTLLAIGYVLSLTAPPTQYKVETSFFKPSEMSIIKLNQYSLLNETANRNEPIVKNGEIIGYLSSGAYGHTLGGAVGLGYIDCEPGESDKDLLSAEYSIEVEGVIEKASVSIKPMYDPLNKKIRA